MEDRDGKKPFIIPKTHNSKKDILITEKPDSRNVTELFDDIKSCALEAHFDFRQNECKSCDTIRNQKLQKLYNEKRIKMKKDQDPIERLAFHLIAYRDVALNVATDGLSCEQLSFPIEKYLGNPKDGVHLSKRPDVLLTSSGAQGLYRFGLLVCKVLLGKGYATIPSTNNNQLAAQLHYDHHFCKVQPINKEQRLTDDLLANSLIFCYEHENFQTVSHPPQVLPIAILWYDLAEKFPPEFLSTTITTTTTTSKQESQHCNGKINNGRISSKKKTSNLSTKPISSRSNKPIISPSISYSGTWEGPIQEPTPNEITHYSDIPESPTLSTTKYPSQFMVPYHRPYSHPPLFTSISTEQQQQTNSNQQITTPRDPRLLRTKRETALISSETIPLSPQHLMQERSLSDLSLSIKPLKTSPNEPILITKTSSLIHIPLNPSIPLIDPRLETLKQTRNIFYLELHAVKHALQQQKRLNHYYDSKNGLLPKTSYTLVPFLKRQVSSDEYERLLNDNNHTYKFNKHSNGIDYSSLYVSVVDCCNFGLLKTKTDNQIYIDLEQNENKLAFEQIEISNELIQREKQLNSQQIRLRLREKRQRKMQQHINDKQISKSSLTSPSSSISGANSKFYIATGRQLLKEHTISTASTNTHIPTDFLDFFSREYSNENRVHVKHLLAELVGVFIEKYHFGHNQTILDNGQNGEVHHSSIEEPVADNETTNCVIDMDLDSPSPQGLGDHDERFRVPTPPPTLPPPFAVPPLPIINEIMYTQPTSSLKLTHTLSDEPNKVFDDPNYNDRCQKLVEQLKEQYRQMDTPISSSLAIPKSELIIPSEDAVFEACLGQSESSSSENSPHDDIRPLTIHDDLEQEKDILLPLVQDSSTNIQNESNRSRDEFVKLLTKEAFVSKSSSPVKVSYDYHNHRRRSYDDNENEKTSSLNRPNPQRRYPNSSNNKTRRTKSPHSSKKKTSSTRTVTLVSSNSSNDNQQTIEQSTDNQNNLPDENSEEPTIKRVKVDLTSPSANTNETNQKSLGLKSVVTVPTTTDDHDYRRDLDDRRRATTAATTPVVSTTDIPINKPSRSKSKDRNNEHDHYRQGRQSSTNSRNSSMKTSKLHKTIPESKEQSREHSRSSSVSSRTSSLNNNRHRYDQKQNRNEYRHERNRSSDLASNRYHKQHSNQLFDRPDMSYRNSLSLPYHQHNTNDLILPNNIHHIPQQQQPLRHRRFNYNHQSVADHPRFANLNVLPAPTPLMDFDFPKSPTHHRSISPVAMGDRNLNSPYYQNNYIDQSESTTMNYSNCFDTKPSHTIERLQMLLENKTTESFEQSQTDSKYSSSLTNTDNSHWSSSSYSSTTTPDTIMPNNNQTFSYNDTEQLLMMVQRLRN